MTSEGVANRTPNVIAGLTRNPVIIGNGWEIAGQARNDECLYRCAF